VRHAREETDLAGGSVAAEPRAARTGHAVHGLASGVLAAALTTALTVRGLVLNPDGWAYWEGGVSLLSGRGYAYFGGQPIHAWPPLFSGLIALASAPLGVSGATLRVLLAALAAVTAFIWTSLYVSGCGDRPGASAWKGAIALSMALLVGFWYQSLLADTLGLALIGAVSWAVARCAHGRDKAPCSLATLAGLAVSLGALVATRHAALALLPAAAALTASVSARRAPVSRFVAILVATIVLPLAIAAVTAAGVGQLHARVVGLGLARYTPADYGWEIVNGYADLVAHPVLRAGKWVMAIVSVLAFIVALVKLRARGDSSARAALAVAALTLVGTLLTAVLFSLTWVHDELRGRFLWPLPLVAVGTIAVAGAGSTGWRSRGLALVVSLLILVAAGRAGIGVAREVQGKIVVDVTPSTTLRVDHVDQPPIVLGHLTLVSPPDYPWIDRHPGAVRPSDH
jgi:hypothetical protein